MMMTKLVYLFSYFTLQYTAQMTLVSHTAITCVRSHQVHYRSDSCHNI